MAELYSRLHVHISPCFSDQDGTVVAAPSLNEGVGSDSAAQQDGGRGLASYRSSQERPSSILDWRVGQRGRERQTGSAICRIRCVGGKCRRTSAAGGCPRSRCTLPDARASDRQCILISRRAGQQVTRHHHEPLKSSSSPFPCSLLIAACNFTYPHSCACHIAPRFLHNGPRPHPRALGLNPGNSFPKDQVQNLIKSVETGFPPFFILKMKIDAPTR